MFHQSFYPQSQQEPPSSSLFHNSRQSNHFSMPAHSYFYRPGPIPNQSGLNLNFSRDFEHFSMPNYGYGYPFFDTSNQNFNQQRWKYNIPKGQQQQRRTPAFYFQDKSTFYYMSDPIVTNDDRITIQLTKVHIGPNGDQQRVFVEQEFSNENELNKFVRNLRHNFKKTFNNRATGVNSSDENQNIDSTKPGLIVVEEPDEEPKVYEQQVYNENIETNKDREQFQRSSCSTIRSNRYRKGQMKYRRQKKDNHNEQQYDKSSRIFPTPSYSRHYQPPPRFQQRKENNFSGPPNLNAHWRHSQGLNEYPYPSNNRSRAHIPPPQTPLHFQQFKEPFFRPIHPSTPPRFRQRRNQQQQQRPTIIAENLVFTNNKQQQTRVHRTRSDCRQKFQHEYHDDDEPVLQQQFIPIVLTSSVFYPQRRFARNTQIQLRLFNPYRLGSNRF